MMALSNRQQLAKRLADELGKYEGVWIVSPLPLDNTAKLRVQILDTECNAMLQIIRDWGWDPVFVSLSPQRVTYAGFQMAPVYEVDLPRDAAPVPADDRTIRGEIAQPKKTDVEIEGMRRYLGLTVPKKREPKSQKPQNRR